MLRIEERKFRRRYPWNHHDRFPKRNKAWKISAALSRSLPALSGMNVARSQADDEPFEDSTRRETKPNS